LKVGFGLNEHELAFYLTKTKNYSPAAAIKEAKAKINAQD